MKNPRNRGGSLPAIVVSAMLLGMVSIAAQQPALFTAGNRSVAIYATVLDKNGRLVTDLTRDDFDVKDNGKLVDLSVFSAEPQPITIAILIDTSGSMRETMPLVVSATENLIGLLLPDDRARLGAFGDRTRFSPRFTANHAELLQFLHKNMQAGGDTPLWSAVDFGMVYLKDIPGRRVVLVLTDGVDTTTLGHGFDAVKKRADDEEVMIYAVGCWNGPGSGDDKPDGNLRKIADHTGGGYTELTWQDDISATFARVAEELHHQYVLGFTPATFDGKVHNLDIRVKRPGLSARARKTYMASDK